MKLATAAAFVLAMTTGAWAEGKTHYIAMHVDENDPQVMNLTLNNAQNVAAYYKSQGDDAMIEIVAYGPGLNMYVKGKSPVADRIATMGLENPNLTFAACGNTMAKMKEKTGADVPLVDEAKVVTSGVVRLVELQEQGYAYVRP